MEEPNSVCTIFFFNLFGFNFSPLAAGCFIFSHLVSLVILKAVNFDDGHINWNSWIDSKRRAQCASLIDALHQLLSGVTPIIVADSGFLHPILSRSGKQFPCTKRVKSRIKKNNGNWGYCSPE